MNATASIGINRHAWVKNGNLPGHVRTGYEATGHTLNYLFLHCGNPQEIVLDRDGATGARRLSTLAP